VISIVIPAYNEQNAIADTVQHSRAVLENAGLTPCQVVVVDDGSTDRTAENAREAGATVVSHLYNLGYGRALKSGIAASQFDIVVITDADGTYPLNRIPDLVAEHQKGFDMVVGRRQGGNYWELSVKAPLRFLLRLMVEFATGQTIPDINSGLRVFGKKGVQPYLAHLCNTFSFTTSLTLAYMMTGKYVQYIPIDYLPRVGRTKVRLFKDSLRTMQYIVQAIIYYNPIKIFLLMSLLTLLFGVFCFLLASLLHLAGSFLILVWCILVAIIIFSLGLVADLLRQIMHK
jgi:glycosyltransferase involved in cell wall biosynthesis